MLTIGIDIDDTLTDTTCIVRKYFMESNNRELINNMEEIIRGYYKSDEITLAFKNMRDRLINEVKVKKGVREAIEKLHNKGYKIVLITARDDNYFGDAYKVCYDYLTRNGIVFDKLLVGRTYKIETCEEENVDIIIDDSVEVIDKAISIGLDAILITSSLNVDRETKGQRFSNWDSIYKYIDKKYNNKE